MIDKSKKKVDKSGFLIQHMVRRKFAAIDLSKTGKEIKDTMFYSEFSKGDINSFSGEQFKLRGYMSPKLLNKTFGTNAFFSENHIRLDDTENKIAYLFKDI